MGKPSLILAALAADALPGLRFIRVQNLTREDVAITVELLTTDEDRLILLKSPLNSLANTGLGTEVRALQILKNLSLPFPPSWVKPPLKLFVMHLLLSMCQGLQLTCQG